MSSVSSASSSSNSETHSYRQIMDIKQNLDYNYMPNTLRKLRVVFIMVFVVLVATSGVMFGLNNYNKNRFLRNANAMNNMKWLRILFTDTKVQSLMMLTTANTPYTNLTDAVVQQNNWTNITDQFYMY